MLLLPFTSRSNGIPSAAAESHIWFPERPQGLSVDQICVSTDSASFYNTLGSFAQTGCLAVGLWACPGRLFLFVVNGMRFTIICKCFCLISPPSRGCTAGGGGGSTAPRRLDGVRLGLPRCNASLLSAAPGKLHELKWLRHLGWANFVCFLERYLLSAVSVFVFHRHFCY